MTDDNLSKRIHDERNAVFSINPPFPDRQIIVEVTNICNHACIFCAREKMSRKQGFIDREFFIRIMREAYELGIHEAGFQIAGEPFACRQLAEYIHISKEIGYTYLFITTNGALATEETLKECFDAGLDSIKFSINAGSRETYIRVHGKDDFDKVMENVRFCHTYREETGKSIKLYASFVVTDLTAGEIKSFKSEIEPLVDEIVFFAVKNMGGLRPDNAHIQPKTVAKFTDEPLTVCVRPFNSVCVTYDGLLIACCQDLHANLVGGDLHEMSLKEAWYSDKMTGLRRRILENDLEGLQCKQCMEEQSCGIRVFDV